MKDFVPVTRVGSFTLMLVVNPKLPIHSVKELVDYAKANPGKLSFASGNTAGIVGGETFAHWAGIDVLQVPYKSTPPALEDIIAGRVSMMFADFTTAMPHVNSGALRALAISRIKRSALYPSLPTLDEAGSKGFNLDAWAGIVAPAGTPPDVVAKLNTALRKIIDTPTPRPNSRMSASKASPRRRRSSATTSRPSSSNGARWSRTPTSRRIELPAPRSRGGCSVPVPAARSARECCQRAMFRTVIASEAKQSSAAERFRIASSLRSSGRKFCGTNISRNRRPAGASEGCNGNRRFDYAAGSKAGRVVGQVFRDTLSRGPHRAGQRIASRIRIAKEFDRLKAEGLAAITALLNCQGADDGTHAERVASLLQGFAFGAKLASTLHGEFRDTKTEIIVVNLMYTIVEALDAIDPAGPRLPRCSTAATRGCKYLPALI